MSIEWFIALMVALSQIAGNFVFQAITKQQWSTAFERSFFQVVAIVVLMVALKTLGGAK